MSDIVYRQLIVTGPDAENFLQGQLCNDVSHIGEDVPQLTGLCSPKGRLLALFRATRVLDGGTPVFTLRCPAEIADPISARLRMYVLRAKVSIDLGDDITGPGTAELIQAGEPEILIATQDAFVPQMVNLDLLNGMSFTKGCYPGQEIAARMKYRGQLKRRMLRFSCASGNLHAGTKLDNAAGDVVLTGPTANGIDVLAVVRLDQLNSKLTVEGSTLQPLEMRYSIPD